MTSDAGHPILSAEDCRVAWQALRDFGGMIGDADPRSVEMPQLRRIANTLARMQEAGGAAAIVQLVAVTPDGPRRVP